MTDETQNTAEKTQSTPLPQFNPVSSIVRREVRAPVTRGMPSTRASHKNWKRTMMLLKALGKRP
jgi:hypothetical protein